MPVPGWPGTITSDAAGPLVVTAPNADSRPIPGSFIASHRPSPPYTSAIVARTPLPAFSPGLASSACSSSAPAGRGPTSASTPVRSPSGITVSGPAYAPRSRMNPHGSADTLSR
jgi:hypothetical protein